MVVLYVRNEVCLQFTGALKTRQWKREREETGERERGEEISARVILYRDRAKRHRFRAKL